MDACVCVRGCLLYLPTINVCSMEMQAIKLSKFIWKYSFGCRRTPSASFIVHSTALYRVCGRVPYKYRFDISHFTFRSDHIIISGPPAITFDEIVRRYWKVDNIEMEWEIPALMKPSTSPIFSVWRQHTLYACNGVADDSRRHCVCVFRAHFPVINLC